ncbi:MAG: OmpA family protein, partial [Capnocytophaga sp.]|nr:OmpA family protein [Capnocytophaga sp.]
MAAVFAFGAVAAQETSSFGFGQGDVIVEGNLKFNSTSSDSGNSKTTTFNFSPGAGYFITDDLAVGLGLNISSAKTKSGSTITTDTSGFGVGVFGRYYFLELGQRFKTYG